MSFLALSPPAHGYLRQKRDHDREFGPQGARELVSLVNWARHRLVRSRRFFELAGQRYPYFYGRYHTTWHSERAVEIPIGWEVARRAPAGRLLEVGNVLPHYFDHPHTVIDKSENVPDVVNVDVVDYDPGRDFDVILSISTLEHVGFNYDEEPDREKILAAFERLRSLLSPVGRLVVTLPVGYNPAVDDHLRTGALSFDRMLCLKRVGRDNRWVEAGWPDIAEARYGEPFQAANALVVGVIGADGGHDVAGLAGS